MVLAQSNLLLKKKKKNAFMLELLFGRGIWDPWRSLRKKMEPWVSEIPSEESWSFSRDGLDIYSGNSGRAS